ncbi:MAG TPA: hypothetical protein VF614_01395 [Chthoniobacteraceae bacterium]|jgi:hypothetical protein
MSRSAFCECGHIENGQPPSLDPLNGWFWPRLPQTNEPPPSIVGFTPAEFFSLWWNIRKLRIAGEQSRVRQDPEDEETDGEIYGTTNFDFTADLPGSEIDLVATAPEFDGFVSLAVGDSVTQFVVTLQLNLHDFWRFEADELIYPSIAISVGQASAAHSVQVLGDRPSAFTVTILGHSVPMWETDGETTDLITGSLTITAGEFWEYRDDDELNPIYDATTGEQLIFPLPTGL